MLYIKKKKPSGIIRTGLKKAGSTSEWKSIASDDTKALRKYFNDLPNKAELRESLGKEQHHLCAYCMRRIDFADALHTQIEHFSPLSEDKDGVLNYDNYLLVCDGGTKSDILSDENRVLCCDKSKGNQRIELNPMLSYQMKHIRYHKTGRVYYRDPHAEQYAQARNHEINHVLCLNGVWDDTEERTLADTSTGIVKGRRDTYQAAINYIQHLERRIKQNQAFRAQLTEKIQELERTEKYPEFVGVMLFVLKRKLRQIT